MSLPALETYIPGTDLDYFGPVTEPHEILVMSGDGARLVYGGLGLFPGVSWTDTGYVEGVEGLRKRHPDMRMIYYGPNTGFPQITYGADHPEYLPYLGPDDGTERRRATVLEPVNQIPYLTEWRGHLARFAHELDQMMESKTLKEATEEDRLTIFNQWSTAIGYSWGQFAEWVFMDPDPNNYPLADRADANEWALPENLDRLRALDVLLCGDCDSPSYPRHFLRRADLAAFKAKYQVGALHGVNRSAPVWVPGEEIVGIPDFLTEGLPIQAQQDIIRLFFSGYKDDNYPLALDHYDEVIGIGERAHGH